MITQEKFLTRIFAVPVVLALLWLVAMIWLVADNIAVGTVAVDIYECPKVSTDGPVELTTYSVTCLKGETPDDKSCKFKGIGKLPPGTVDAEACS